MVTRHLNIVQRPIMAVSGGVLAVGALTAAWLLLGQRGTNGATSAASANRLEDIPFDGARAYGYLKQLCEIGPRPSGSAGMEKQQKFLADHFTKLGGQVEFQRFRVQHPRARWWVPMANIIVHWHPKSTERVLLCAHYDTLPFPLRDPLNPRGRFVGANDNAGGVAVLMQLAHDMPSLKTNLGVDFVLLDAEEFIFGERDRYFLGSEFFAREYVGKKPPHRYRWGVLLDMIADADLRIPQEINSRSWPDTRPLVNDLWSIASRLGVKEFESKLGDEVSDDHVTLHDIGRIPCIDVIDFDYPPWHTQGDTPDKCSALSLAKVGWVIREWLKSVK